LFYIWHTGLLDHPEGVLPTGYPWKVWRAVSLIQVLTGLSLVLFGRKLFWLFVGAIGFYVTFGLATRIFQDQPDWVILLIAATVGLGGALLAVFVQSLGVAFASFLAGGTYLTDLVDGAGISLGPFGWFVFVAGGLAAAFLVFFLLEWALILLSSFAGATLVARISGLEREASALVFFTLFLFGLGIQAGTLRWEERREGERL
jgi:hypothetical protein